MIGKLIRSTSGAKERHNRVLAHYILGVHSAEKSSYAGARGFVSDELDGQLAEMTSLAQAARSDAAPIKHLMFSFRAGEVPTPAQVEQVVDECMRTAGLSESHQALFALHQDTQHAHIHVMLNAIDPMSERVTPVEYWHDVLAATCVRLERTLGLASEPGRRIELLADGTLVRRAGGRAIAGSEVDGESRSGIASVKKLARRDRVSAVIKSSRNWDEAHERLAKDGWTYEQRGSGAILRLRRVGLSDVMIKPSEIDVALGFGKLSRRLGPFKPAGDALAKARDIEPARPDLQPSGLWDVFRLHRRILQEAKEHALAELRRQQRIERENLIADLRWEIPAATGGVEDRRVEASIRAALKAQRLEVLRARHAGEREAVYQGLRERLDYEQWLERRIEQNQDDASAVYALRAWQIRHTERVAWSPGAPRELSAGIVHLRPLFDDGFVHYQRGGVTRFTDEGTRVTVGPGASDNDVLAFLRLSHAKWSGAFHLLGDDRFIEQCARVVAVHGARVKVLNRPEFDDCVAANRRRSARAGAPRRHVFSQRHMTRDVMSLQEEQSSEMLTNEPLDPPTTIQPVPEDRVMAARWRLAQAWAIGKMGPTWGAEHDFHAAIALRATGVAHDGVERTLFVMMPRGGEPRSLGREEVARRSAAAAFASFGDKVLASLERDKTLATQLRQSMQEAVCDARIEHLRASSDLRDAVPGEVIRGFVEHSDSRCLIVRVGREVIECPAMLEEMPARHRGVGTWVEFRLLDAPSDGGLAPAP
ncbi:MAG: relaxase/mobilization nuclease domain-containing protein [Proteobacteria bacterium]|nr:relaxase/mobilization nuclease domain-containing protein [Pseudomonadota bacterium]